MVGVYVAALALGVIVWLGRAWAAPADGISSPEAATPADVTAPGARGERSDEYAAGGGVGGAEGEGAPSGSHGVGGGGIGGAEGGDDSSRPVSRAFSPLELVSMCIGVFGAAGLFLRITVPGVSGAATVGLAALTAIGLVGILGSRDRRDDAK